VGEPGQGGRSGRPGRHGHRQVKVVEMAGDQAGTVRHGDLTRPLARFVLPLETPERASERGEIGGRLGPVPGHDGGTHRGDRHREGDDQCTGGQHPDCRRTLVIGSPGHDGSGPGSMAAVAVAVMSKPGRLAPNGWRCTRTVART
jgi:hypothetical protein